MSAREMPAGRALDAEVAEKVMGRRVECGVNCRMDAHGDRLDVDIGFADSLRIVWTSETYEPVPHYSTDIAAAFDVLAKLCADGTIIMASVNVSENDWWCMLYPPLGYGCDSVESEYCETPALAICRAALALLDCSACGQDVRRVPSGRDAQPCRVGGEEA